MADTVLPQPDPQALDSFLRAQARALRANDQAPATKAAWDERRTAPRARSDEPARYASVPCADTA